MATLSSEIWGWCKKDVIDGYVSLESAKMNYGVIINPKTFEINLNATKKLRENIHVRKI